MSLSLRLLGFPPILVTQVSFNFFLTVISFCLSSPLAATFSNFLRSPRTVNSASSLSKKDMPWRLRLIFNSAKGRDLPKIAKTTGVYLEMLIITISCWIRFYLKYKKSVHSLHMKRNNLFHDIEGLGLLEHSTHTIRSQLSPPHRNWAQLLWQEAPGVAQEIFSSWQSNPSTCFQRFRFVLWFTQLNTGVNST